MDLDIYHTGHIRRSLSASGTTTRSIMRHRVEKITQEASSTRANQIGIVRRRTDTNRLRRTTEHVAHLVSEVLEDISRAGAGAVSRVAGVEDLIPDGEVVSRTGSSLEGGVSLQEEVPVACLGDAAVDDGSGDWVLAVRVLLGCWVEAGVVAFSDDDDG